jgi:ABC-type tungstate transport system substrate-binding protein
MYFIDRVSTSGNFYSLVVGLILQMLVSRQLVLGEKPF